MKFPKKLFAKIEGKKGEEYVNAYHAIETIVDAGESVKVGIYELKEIVEARGSVTVVSTKPVKRR
jgi:hypothetical protein